MSRLSAKASEFLDLLTSVARTVVEQRRWSTSTTLVTLFVPQLAVAHALGVDTSTIRRWFYRYEELRERVAMRPHYCSISTEGGGSRTVIDGTLWTVRIGGEGRGEVRVPLEDLQHQGYRNLEFDIQQGTTGANQILHASSTGLVQQAGENLLLGWVFGDRNLTPVGNDACSDTTPPLTLEEAAVAVEDGADFGVLAGVIVRELNDRGSYRYWVTQVRHWDFYWRLRDLALWVRRALTDANEGFARNPAALLVSRLRLPESRNVPTVA